MLGAIIFVYVIIAGMLTPLKPGIINTSPKIAKCGDDIALEITGYNTRFDDCLLYTSDAADE